MTSKPFLIACAEKMVEHNLESPTTSIYRYYCTFTVFYYFIKYEVNENIRNDHYTIRDEMTLFSC